MRKMKQFTPEEFEEEIKELLVPFVANMKSLKNESQTFPEWCETFLAWSEVGTDMEEISWGYEESK